MTRPSATSQRHEREDAFQRWVTDLCDWLHLRWHHETDSRRSKPGFPDLVIVGPAGVIFVELKTQRGALRPDQHQWVDALRQAGAEVHVWRPADRTAIAVRLRALTGRTYP